MRPSIEEQLQGTCRVLETVVAPCVNDPMARTMLDGLIANLRMLTVALPAVPAFLRQDNASTVQLLSALASSLPAELTARLADTLNKPEPDPADVAALDARNQSLRELLAQAVCAERLTDDQHRTILKHMGERASRVPMRYVATTPSPPLTAKT
jgi:hypothetical protein